MICKIQKPVPVQQSPQPAGKHGKLKVQAICNDVPEEEIKFDATSGDIKLKLNCSEPEGYDDDWFIVDNNGLLSEIEKLKNEIEALKDKHELEVEAINKELAELKTDYETLKNAEDLELSDVNEELEELYKMLNSE